MLSPGDASFLGNSGLAVANSDRVNVSPGTRQEKRGLSAGQLVIGIRA